MSKSLSIHFYRTCYEVMNTKIKLELEIVQNIFSRFVSYTYLNLIWKNNAFLTKQKQSFFLI